MSNSIYRTKENWLKKESRYIGQWRKRWVVLTPSNLYTYKQRKVYQKATEMIALSDIQSVSSDATNNILTIHLHNNKHFKFQADSTNDMTDWENAIKGYMNCIKLPIIIECPRNVDYDCNFELTVPYHKDYNYSIDQIVQDAVNYLNKKYHPIKFTPQRIASDSFIGQQISYNDYDWNDCDVFLANYLKDFVIRNGVHLLVDIAIYEHQTWLNHSVCTYLKTKNHKCPIYDQMRYKYIFSENNLRHLNEFEHFSNEFLDRPACRYGDECYAYQRLENGGYDLKDRCHIQIYRHPPRYRRSKPSQDIKSFCLNDEWIDNKPIYSPTEQDQKQYEYNEKCGYLKALITEVVDNGFENDLFLQDDDAKLNNYSILDIVNEKINCMRHKQMGSPLNKGEMLSIILYTGCDSNYDLCKTQRDCDYQM
eukprot:187230_1